METYRCPDCNAFHPQPRCKPERDEWPEPSNRQEHDPYTPERGIELAMECFVSALKRTDEWTKDLAVAYVQADAALSSLVNERDAARGELEKSQIALTEIRRMNSCTDGSNAAKGVIEVEAAKALSAFDRARREAVRVERLQEISEEDAKAEGVARDDEPCDHSRHSCEDVGCLGQTFKSSFCTLWCELHGDDSWRSNPEVVAITFKVEKRNIDKGPQHG